MKEAPARRVLVVGLGNPDRGDDGVGPLVAKELPGVLPTGVAVTWPSGDVLGLIAAWSGFDAVIFIDAAAPATTPGRIHRFDLASSELPRELNYASSHALSLADAIGLARVLRQAPQDIIVYAVEGASFACGAPITLEVAAAAAEVAGRVVAEVARLRQNSSELTAKAQNSQRAGTNFLGSTFANAHNAGGRCKALDREIAGPRQSAGARPNDPEPGTLRFGRRGRKRWNFRA